MRLLNTSSLEFSEFFDSNIPKYAILSHRWGSREVSYKEMRKRSAPPGPGLTKIENFCKMAMKLHSLEWAWVDTCCIDKRSSAELSEAINSMYKWYQRSSVCYVHLSDVELSPEESISWDIFGEPSQFRSYAGFDRQFCESRWFTRGWTLQELLAPGEVLFFDINWAQIGNRSNLAEKISSITRIHEHYLTHFAIHGPIMTASVAQKMSYASQRVTSREEDMAYCLLGLFDVNMPLLYGEGAAASFRRLQIEILQKSDDESLFAWTSDEPVSGMLAFSPSCFAGSGNIVQKTRNPELDLERASYKMTNRGLECPIPNNLRIADTAFITLQCTLSRDEAAGITLRIRGAVAMRIRCWSLKSAHQHDFGLSSVGHIRRTRLVYVKTPDKSDIEYAHLLRNIENGNINLLALTSATSKTKYDSYWPCNKVLNIGPRLYDISPSMSIINYGDVPREEEVLVELQTQTWLMDTAFQLSLCSAEEDRYTVLGNGHKHSAYLEPKDDKDDTYYDESFDPC
ncbi:MAG: hypothetical protein Q9220_002647 [cf. Caloplaca sp. 1 TL-2023]